MNLSTPDTSEPDPHLCALLGDSHKILIFTGAGISTPSGIADFRGPGGVWSRRKPVYYNDFMTRKAARIEHWSFKLEGRKSFRDAQPNRIHDAVVDLEKVGKLLKVVTQNIDGLHQKSGISDDRIVELHGTNSQIECQSCHKRYEPDPHFAYFERTGQPPECRCGGYLKPATISFGQNLRSQDIRAAEQAAGEADLVVALGSTLSVYPAAVIPLLAARHGARYAVINRGPTEHDSEPAVTLRLEGDAAVIFPPAVAKVLTRV